MIVLEQEFNVPSLNSLQIRIAELPTFETIVLKQCIHHWNIESDAARRETECM